MSVHSSECTGFFVDNEIERLSNDNVRFIEEVGLLC